MKKENKTLIIAVTLLIIFSLSATYAYVILTKENSDATGSGGCFVVDYVGGTRINNSSLSSSEAELEEATSTITLSKNENCDIYTESEITIHTTETTADLNGVRALKYKVIKTSGDGKIINKANDNAEISEATGVITVPAQGEPDLVLANVTLTETPTTYKVYLWIDSNVSNGAFNNKTYSGYLYASSVQTSTINQ